MISRRGALAGALAALAAPARADDAVSAAIVLAVDVSSSIDGEHWWLQRKGYAEAFLNYEVIRAIVETPQRKIAVAYFEWASLYSQRVIVPWRIVASEDDGEEIAAALTAGSRPFEGSTGLGAGISFAGTLLAACPFAATQKVIDVSGDGGNNDGPPPESVRVTLASDVRVNGLPIDWVRSHPPSGMTIENYYRASVVGGPNGFCMPAVGFDSFGYALAAKLRMEAV
jgi:hypothetical protein